jgi:hypothetical protein
MSWGFFLAAASVVSRKAGGFLSGGFGKGTASAVPPWGTRMRGFNP